ncbi:MAG: SDR family oxidoreductase [Rhodospirillales bacterium]|nr:SDR family oxidoreductase [Rhodospirillales bacterium]
MTAQFTLAVDAMGGDNAPAMVIDGLELAAERHPGARILLVGDEAAIAPLLARRRRASSICTVRHAPDGIRANAVLPGVIDTPLVRNQIAGRFKDEAEMLKARNAASPMGRMGTAWDVAHAALFLASDEAGYITGVCLPVDGGKSCAGR